MLLPAPDAIQKEPRWTRRSLLHLVGAGTALGALRTARAQGPAVVYPNLNGNGADNLGYRISLVHFSQEAEFAKVHTLAQLRRFGAGQGLGWSNNAIMQAAGIPVVTGPTLESLFPMLEAKRFDFLPLGLNEVYGFSEQYGDYAPFMVVEPHTLLVYKFARLFYVRPDQTALHASILLGLKRAFADGSFQKLLNSDPSVRRALLRAKLSQRSTIVLDNPLLTEAFQAIPDEYFFKPSEFK